MADGTSTRVMTCMINRWRAKIDCKGIYNVGDPPRMGDGIPGIEEKKEKTGAVCMIPENLYSLAPKKE